VEVLDSRCWRTRRRPLGQKNCERNARCAKLSRERSL
jgi:hypothetical protein